MKVLSVRQPFPERVDRITGALCRLCVVDHDYSYPENYENEIARAIIVLAGAVNSVATQLKYLGNGNAATEMGAIEGLAKIMKEGMVEVANAVSGCAPYPSDYSLEKTREIN